MSKIKQLLARRKQWERMYPKWYIALNFTLYDGELEAILKFFKRHKGK